MPSMYQFIGENGYRANVRFKNDRSSGLLVAELVLTRNGVPCWRGELGVPLHEIRQEVIAALNNRPGWGWGAIKKAAKGLASKVGVTRLVKEAKKIATNPLLVGIYPPLGVSVASIRKGVALLSSAKKGVTAAKSQIKGLAAMAKQGDPKAGKAMVLLTTLDTANKGGKDLQAWSAYLAKDHGPAPEVIMSGVFVRRPGRQWARPQFDPRDPRQLAPSKNDPRALIARRLLRGR